MLVFLISRDHEHGTVLTTAVLGLYKKATAARILPISLGLLPSALHAANGVVEVAVAVCQVAVILVTVLITAAIPLSATHRQNPQHRSKKLL